MKKAVLPNIPLGNDIKELEAQALDSFRNDPAIYEVITKELELTNKEVKLYLGALLDLQEDMATCRNCPGMDKCPKRDPHYSLKLNYVEGILTRSYEPCEKKAKLDELTSRFFVADFPSEWLDKNLTDVDRTEARKGILLAYAKILKNDDPRWIYLVSNANMGKSFMLALMAKEYGEKHHPVGFVNTAKLIDGLKERAINDKEKFERQMRLLESCPLLVLDEFGNEFKSDYVFSSVLFPILSVRSKAGLATWFSSDFEIDEIVSMYSAKIGAVRAKQFKKLLQTMCKGEMVLDGVSVY